MKKRILFLVFVVIALVSVVRFYNPLREGSVISKPPQPGSGDKFLVGCIQSAPFIYENYDEMGINFAHSYIGEEWNGELKRHTPKCDWLLPYGQTDHLFDSVPTTAIVNKLNEIYSHNGSRNGWCEDNTIALSLKRYYVITK